MIHYEWSVEHVDEYGDIQDVEFVDKLSELWRDWDEPISGCERVDLCLRRHDFIESEGVRDTEYYYPDADGILTLFDLEFKSDFTAIKSKQTEYDKFIKSTETHS